MPLILFKTHSEFEQQNVIPGAAPEGVAAFAESDRTTACCMPLDEPPDLLYRTLTHELTHIFQFDIIPQSLIRRNMPLWVSEGHADYVRGALGPARPDDGARRGRRRHRAEDERDSRATATSATRA